MANKPTTMVTGVLVALTSTGYDFVDRSTGERKVGSTVRAFIAAEDGSTIDECKVPDQARNQFEGVAMGTPVQALCEINARVTGANRAVTELSVVSLRVASPAK